MNSYMTSIERQIRESLYIEHTDCDIIMNGKGEWGANLVPRANFNPENPTFGNNINSRLNRISNMATNNSNTETTSSGNTLATNSNINLLHQDSVFNSQYHQRKKRKRATESGNIATEGNMNAATVNVLNEQQDGAKIPTPIHGILGGNRANLGNSVKQQNGNRMSNMKRPKVPDRWSQMKLNFSPIRPGSEPQLKKLTLQHPGSLEDNRKS